MKPYLVKTPKFVQRIFPERVWAFPNTGSAIYLTFDDGPIPEVTPWVLDTLKNYNAKATFFCIGDNIKKHPAIFQRMLDEGHAIGNHTQNHLNGWNTNTEDYIANIEKGATSISEFEVTEQPQLFRPPYGKITSEQCRRVQSLGYKIIMWDVLSADFDAKISEEKCYTNVAENLAAGSIVVFHDSLKAAKNMMYALPKILQQINTNGWHCTTLE